MIKRAVNTKLPHQYQKYVNMIASLFVADYTEQTKLLPIKRGVEFHPDIAPIDNLYFTLKNDVKLEIGGIPFDNLSFVCGTNSRSQCECVVFPHDSDQHSWVLFAELKYRQHNNNFNRGHIKKAIRQVYRTRYYYMQEGIISLRNTSYLIISFPLQRVPFKGFTPTQAQLMKLKRDKNIILAFTNTISVIDQKSLKIV
ncbi:hypothetical protein [Pedobacter metabolipauper]|uniref:Uncharacterized protein n=1 Tax=Pedobacter metabolipauper TaxID=425513 RepID=A0A4R6SSR7_9SPHI|nr:hypothetical protein [Pedobacter metabolipauper]TDQ08435.1 hypothetical protein ATK78_2948 [Pedobacter metabolipauper]